MKDATSLPWPALRGAWATSMHDLEEGHLGCQDATQWSIIHLSASQISMASSQASQVAQHRKLCKFFNEGTCSHDASHGIYKHVCAYCEKQGKVGNHPESKCFTKLRVKDKVSSNYDRQPSGQPPHSKDGHRRTDFEGRGEGISY